MENGAATDRITRNPAVLGGKPNVRGTRISVALIDDWVQSGHTSEEIVDDYPVLTSEDIESAVACTKPRREPAAAPTTAGLSESRDEAAP